MQPMKPMTPNNSHCSFSTPLPLKAVQPTSRPVVKIELGARAETEPVELPVIQPFLAEAFPDLFTESTFIVSTVAARRTFWEKAMLLHEEQFRPADRQRKARLSRHYYDLWCLIEGGIAKQAMEDTGLFERIAKHRQIFYRQTWVDYNALCRGSLDLIPSEKQRAEWQHDYETMRGVMFFNEPPSFDEILQQVRQFQDEFNAGGETLAAPLRSAPITAP